jgi:hypothetical protein
MGLDILEFVSIIEFVTIVLVILLGIQTFVIKKMFLSRQQKLTKSSKRRITIATLLIIFLCGFVAVRIILSKNYTIDSILVFILSYSLVFMMLQLNILYEIFKKDNNKKAE